LGDFWTGYDFLENLVPSRARGLGFEISFNLRRGEWPKDKGDDLALNEVEVNGCRKAEMAVVCQIQELYVDFRNWDAVDQALRDIPEVEGEVFWDEESLVVRQSSLEVTRNGMVGDDVGVVFITSIIERGCDLYFEGEDASDYLCKRDTRLSEDRLGTNWPQLCGWASEREGGWNQQMLGVAKNLQPGRRHLRWEIWFEGSRRVIRFDGVCGGGRGRTFEDGR
jgi:hypothetical protein